MEQRRLSEADWKVWRQLHAVALDRYCQKILRDAAKLENGEGTSHERYLKLYRLLKQRDKKLGDIFNNPRRSDAYLRIALAVKAGVLTEEEVAKFSEDTRNVIAILSGNLR